MTIVSEDIETAAAVGFAADVRALYVKDRAGWPL